MRKTNVVIIVGSGPTAYIAAREYVSRGLRVTIVTPNLNNRLNESLDSLLRNEKILLKDRFEKPWVYYRRAASQVTSENQVEINETLAFGGLSNIWGAVSFLPPKVKKYLPFMSIEEISSMLFDLEDFFHFTHTDSEIWRIHTQLHSAKVEIGGTEVPQMKDQNFNNWNAMLAWEMLDPLLINYIEGYAISFDQPKQGHVSLTVQLSNGITEIFDCDELYIATGPFGNAKIILNSHEKLKELVISDSNVVYRLYFDFRLRQMYEKSMNPSRIYLMQPKSESNGGLYVQFYSLSEQLIQALKFKGLHKFLKRIAKVLAPFISLGIVFRAGTDSKGILLQKNDREQFSASQFPAQKRAPKLCRSLTEVLKSGLVPTPFVINAKVGAGVHSGAFLCVEPSKAKYGLYSDEISSWSRVHFLGSSNLANIPPGPITLLGLCQALYVTRNVIHQIEK
jgi:hypothetical protein